MTTDAFPQTPVPEHVRLDVTILAEMLKCYHLSHFSDSRTRGWDLMPALIDDIPETISWS